MEMRVGQRGLDTGGPKGEDTGAKGRGGGMRGGGGYEGVPGSAG